MADVLDAAPGAGAVEKLPRVDLQPRLIAADDHGPARLRIGEAGDGAHRSGGGTDDEVVIELGQDVPRRSIVERRACDRFDGAGGDDRIARGEGVGGDRQQVTENVACAGEVPVGVVGQVDGRRLIGRRAHLDAQLVVVRERVGRPRIDRARIPGVPFGGTVEQRERGAIHLSGRDGPVGPVPAPGAAVQVVGRVVGVEVIRDSPEHEARVADPVRDPAADRAEEDVLPEVAVRIVEPQHDVAEPAVAIGDAQLDQRRAEREDRRRRAVRVDQRVKGGHRAARSAG